MPQLYTYPRCDRAIVKYSPSLRSSIAGCEMPGFSSLMFDLRLADPLPRVLCCYEESLSMQCLKDIKFGLLNRHFSNS